MCNCRLISMVIVENWNVLVKIEQNALICFIKIINFIWLLRMQIASIISLKNCLKTRWVETYCPLWWEHLVKTMKNTHHNDLIFMLKTSNRPRNWPTICTFWIQIAIYTMRILNGKAPVSLLEAGNIFGAEFVQCCMTNKVFYLISGMKM